MRPNGYNWPLRHRVDCSDLDALEEPTDSGQALYVGGFVLADRFDTVLRRLSETYLCDLWDRLRAALESFGIKVSDLSWGYMHSGETRVPGHGVLAPIDFVGWTSRQLATFDRDARYGDLDEALRSGQPALACAVTWRSLKWHIAPDSFALALRLIEALATDEATFWAPEWILGDVSNPGEPWLKVAAAIRADCQRDVDDALAEASDAYTPLGYRVLVRGNMAYLALDPDKHTVHLPHDYMS